MSGRRQIPVPTVWGVGTVGPEPWAVSPADVADETESAVEHLRTLGIGAGGLVLIVSRLAETIHVAPLELAAGRLDARWSSADATEGDAFRVASLVRQLTPDAVIGINATIVAALDDARSVFASVPVVAVTDHAAWHALDGARWWLRLGPTSAFECAARDGAHLDATRWRVDRSDDGELLVTSVAARLTPATRLPCGLRGSVVDEPCPCGRPGPRVRVAS